MPFLAPIVSAVSGAIAAIGSFLGPIGSAIAKTVIGIGLQFAAQALLKKKDPPGGTSFEREYGENQPRRVACGVVAMAGHDCYVNTYAPSNRWLQQLYVLSDYYSSGLSRLAIDGEWVALDPVEDPDKGFTPASPHKLHSLIWVKFYDGTQIAADAQLVAQANPSTRWTAEHVGYGMTHVIVTMAYDKDKNAQFPQFFFEFFGAPLYDWRKDDTAGGTGPHRWGDVTTHEFTENPRVIEYNYRRGLSVNGDLFCGMDMPAGDLPLDRWTLAANHCDETVDGEARYRVSVLLNCMAQHSANIESLLQSCAGMNVDAVDGVWPLAGTAQAPVVTFTDDDLVAGAPLSVRMKPSMADRVNSVSGTYPDAENLWAATPYDTQTDAVALAIDRRTRDVEMSFPQVASRRQATALAAIYLAENRFQATAQIVLPPRFRGIEAGDWVTWNSARYGAVTWLVTGTSRKALSGGQPRVIVLTLMQRDASIYAPGPTPTPVPDVPLPADAVLAAETVNLQVIAATATGADGRQRPAIRVSWDAHDDDTVTGVEIEYYPDDDPAAVLMASVAADVTVATLVNGVIGASGYQVRTRLVTDPPRTIAWSAWNAVVTPDVRIGRLDVYNGIIDLPALASDVSNLQAWIGGTVRDLWNHVNGSLQARTDMDLANWEDQQSLRRELISTTDNITASYTEAIDVATGSGSALAIAITALQVQLGNDGADAVFKIETGYTPAAGWTSRIGMQASVTAGGTLFDAGMFIEAKADSSRILFKTDQFVITDGTDDDTPFVFSGGVLTLAVAKVADITAGMLRSSDNKLQVDLDNKRIVMAD